MDRRTRSARTSGSASGSGVHFAVSQELHVQSGKIPSSDESGCSTTSDSVSSSDDDYTLATLVERNRDYSSDDDYTLADMQPLVKAKGTVSVGQTQKRRRLQQSVVKSNNPTARRSGASDAVWSTISPVEQSKERGTWCPEFSEETGLKLNTDEFEPLDYFGLYFDDVILSSIVEETNRYAMQKTDSATGRFARLRNYSPVTINELRIFFAMQIIMGVKRLPEISDYWSRYWVFHDVQFASLMTSRR